MERCRVGSIVSMCVRGIGRGSKGQLLLRQRLVVQRMVSYLFSIACVHKRARHSCACACVLIFHRRTHTPHQHPYACKSTLKHAHSPCLSYVLTLSIARYLFFSIGICSCPYACFKFALHNKRTLPFCLCLSHTPSRSGPFFPPHTQVPASRLLGARVRQNRSPRFSMFRYRIVRVFKNRSVHNFILLYCYREL